MKRALLLLVLLAVPLVASATTRYVAPGGTDTGDCSVAAAPCATIAYAVGQSLSGDLLSVAAGTYAAGATLDRDVTVEGAGQDQTTVSGPFTINAGVTAALRDLTVQGARVVNNGEAALERVTVTGATAPGVRNTGTMTLTDALISDNDATSISYLRGGGIHNTGTLTLLRTTVRDNDLYTYEAGCMGGGIYNEGSLTVVESLIQDNTVYESYNDNGYGAGIYNLQGVVSIIDSTIRGNEADGGGGLSDYDGEGTITISGSTFEGNRANIGCGAISASATLFNSTVSGNEGTLCGRMTLEFSTVTNNAVNSYSESGALSGTFRLRNTIVAGNEADCSRGDDWGDPYTLISYDYNVLGDLGSPDDCVLIGELDHTLVGVEDPMLGPLADNGGLTRTHALLDFSPAIEAGTCTDLNSNTVAEDQRGEPRPRGVACDVGSIERDGLFLTAVPAGAPVVLPPEGGTVDFDVVVVNATSAPQVVNVWGRVRNAAAGFQRDRPPRRLSLAPDEVRTRSFSVTVPARAPAGAYRVLGAIGTHPDVVLSVAGFTVEKLTSPYTIAASLVSPPGGAISIAGGPFSYEVTVTNVTHTTRTLDAWGDLARPDGLVSPYVGPAPLTLAPGEAFTYAATDSLIAEDPPGHYTLAFYAGSYPDGGTAADSFAVVKAGPRYVTTTGTDAGNTCLDAANPCATIRHALSVANDGDVVDLPAGTYTEAGLAVDKEVTIRGAGATIVQAAATPGTALDRVFLVDFGAVAVFEDLTIRHGRKEGGGGGGIINYATLRVSRSAISANAADWGGGIDNHGTLVLTASTVSANTAYRDGGGLRNTREADIVNSTVSGNVANRDGGGIHSWSVNAGLHTRISHSTITGNTANADGDHLGHGGGLTVGGWDPTVEIRGAIVYDNADLSSLNPSIDCYMEEPWMELTSRDYLHIGDLGNCSLVGDTDHIFLGLVGPIFGPLVDNGGPTLTHALLPDAPAVDAGTCTDLTGNAVAVDQREAPRPFGPACDIGAFEFGAVPPMRLASPMSVLGEAAGRASAQAGADVPATYALLPAYPNPLARVASLRYGLPEAAHVRLAVYDVLGREVAVLVDAEREAGWHAARLDAARLAAGTYLYRLTAGDFRATRRLTVLR